MEATKKKKAYLKPEMTKFEMGTEGTFMAVSRAPMDTPIIIECFNIDNNSFLLGGDWSALADANFTGSISTKFKNGNTPHADQLEGAGFLEGDCLTVKRATSEECPNQNTNQVTIMVTRVDCN